MTVPVTVVIADDHDAFRHGLRQMLARAGGLQVVGEAVRGDAALALIEALQPALAVLDIRMPHLDGLEVARLARRRSQATRVVMITMYDDPDLMREALDIGVDGYVLKDDAAAELGPCLRAVAGGARYISTRLADPENHRALTARDRSNASHDR